RVSYRETVRKACEAEEQFHRASQGESTFASVKVRIEPFDGDQAIAVVLAIQNPAIPGDLQAVALEAVRDSAQSGGRLGYPLLHVKFTILDIGYKDGETTEEALRAAAAHAVQSSVTKADIALLEPIMKVEVVT